MNDQSGLTGEIVLTCTDEFGNVKWTETVKNLITTVGDNYYAQRALAAVTPDAPADATKVTCMKLGNQSSPTAASKTSTGAGLQAYITGSNAAFSSVSRSSNAITYNASWAAGTATDAAISEIVIAVTNANSTSVAADCIARAVISPTKNKTASDTLTAAWTHTFLGA